MGIFNHAETKIYGPEKTKKERYFVATSGKRRDILQHINGLSFLHEKLYFVWTADDLFIKILCI